MMPLAQSPRQNAAHACRGSSTRNDGAPHNIQLGDRFAARSLPLNAVCTHHDRPLVRSNLGARLCGSPSLHFDTDRAALKSP
jgi:hypothetical protein